MKPSSFPRRVLGDLTGTDDAQHKSLSGIATDGGHDIDPIDVARDIHSDSLGVAAAAARGDQDQLDQLTENITQNLETLQQLVRDQEVEA